MDPRGQSWMFLRRNKSLARILILDHTANNPIFIVCNLLGISPMSDY